MIKLSLNALGRTSKDVGLKIIFSMNSFLISSETVFNSSLSHQVPMQVAYKALIRLHRGL